MVKSLLDSAKRKFIEAIPDDEIIAYAPYHLKLELEVSRNLEILCLEHRKEFYREIEFTNDGRYLFTHSPGCNIQVWRLSTVPEIIKAYKWAYTAKFESENCLIINVENKVIALDLQTGSETILRHNECEGIGLQHISISRQSIIVVDQEQEIHRWWRSTKQLQGGFKHDSSFDTLLLSVAPDGTRAVSVIHDEAFVISTNPDENYAPIRLETNMAKCAVWSPDQTRNVIAVMTKNRLEIFHFDNIPKQTLWLEIDYFPSSWYRPHNMIFSPDGSYIAIDCHLNLRVFKIKGEVLEEVYKTTGSINCHTWLSSKYIIIHENARFRIIDIGKLC
ncbi:hypothetical protein M433DRAFT_545156 [Acidomyces richmondensis BFW]|nr:hypothetical protein M433DRAFT_545156 [Acidomyces richmondensis BFW]